jgi:hypothetical protein
MKRITLVVSALAALTTGASTVAQHHDRQPSQGQALLACIEFKDLILEIGTLLYKRKLDQRGLSRLTACFHKDTIAGLFAEDVATFGRYVDTESLSDFCTLMLEGHYDSRAREKKARTLRKCFNIDTLEEEFQCEGLRPVLDYSTKLIYFSGTQEEKRELIRKLKRAVTKLHRDQKQDLLDRYFNFDAIHEVLDGLLNNDINISQEQLLSILKSDSINAIPQENRSLRAYVLPHKCLTFLIELIGADLREESLPWTSLVSCVRWDALCITIPECLGHTQSTLRNFFSVQHLKEQITLLQEGKELTADGLRSVIRFDAFEMALINEEQIEACINFEHLAQALNALRRGEQSHSLAEVCNFPRIEDMVGVDLQSAMNADLPEGVQRQKYAQAVDHITTLNPGLIAVILGAPTLLWLIGHGLCHPCMELFEPHQLSSAGILLFIIGAALYKGVELYHAKKPMSTLIGNAVSVKAHRAAAQLLPRAFPKSKELLNYKPTNPELHEPYTVFIGLLTDEHLATLTKPIDLVNLFEKPRTFVTKNSTFMEGLCTLDIERTLERIRIIAQLLESVVPVERLPHTESIDTFFDNLHPDTLKLLPHPGIVVIARYCPHILQNKAEFLRKASSYILGDRPVVWYFHDALYKAQDIHEIDCSQ